MNIPFVVQYCRALLAHLVLAWQCRTSGPRGSSGVNAVSETASFNSIAGRRTCIDMERKVAELLSADHHRSAALLLAAVLISMAARGAA